MAPTIFSIFSGYNFLNDFIKNPQTRNARTFLTLNISAVGSVSRLTMNKTLLITLNLKISNGFQSCLLGSEIKILKFQQDQIMMKTIQNLRQTDVSIWSLKRQKKFPNKSLAFQIFYCQDRQEGMVFIRITKHKSSREKPERTERVTKVLKAGKERERQEAK